MGFASRTLSIRESAPVKLAVANLIPFEKLREDSPTIVAPAFSGDGLRSKKTMWPEMFTRSHCFTHILRFQ